ncbi:MAG: protein kinase domain-containing protein [Cyanobacteriota bacterium]
MADGSRPWILPLDMVLRFEGLQPPVHLVRGLGGGTQGQVFEVEVAGEPLALKWYFPNCIAADPNLERRLLDSIQATSPNPSFLWPIALLRAAPDQRERIPLARQSFGYLMPLRSAGFIGAHEHVGGLVDISLQTVLRASFFLADAFHDLHLRGLCYKDISLMNLFLEPDSGRILICDNDNVAVDGRDPGSVLGTPGFMAPDELLGQARPGANSDLFSLAVLIFRLLTRHDPLLGQMELAIRCLDEPARRRLYGEDPVFIFDPHDSRNRPDPQEHPAALITWPIYPSALQALFLQTFGIGMKTPSQRALTGQWKQVLADCLDQRRLCPHCGQETFPDPGTDAPCWHCGKTPGPGLSLVLPHGLVQATAGNELHPHHFDNLKSRTLTQPVGRLETHPGRADLIGLRNLEQQPWQALLLNGQSLVIAPGQACNLAPLARLETPAGPITVLR